MKQTIAIYAGALALALAAAQPAAAQLVYPVPPPGAAVVMPPYEVVAMVRSTGLEPLSHPVRHGPAYVLRAVDPAGQVMRVVVDARLGRIVRVMPALGPRYAAPMGPPPYGRPPGAIALMPDGYSPNSRIAALPPGLDGPPVHGPGSGYDGLPGARAPAALAPQPSAQAGPPPLPRPRPNVASAAKSDAAPAAAPKEAKEANDTTTATPAAAAPPPVEMQE